ncbi:lasso peptide biosynthesis B2 protein [Elongatibacter sediminis]|uniref:lasso peptide biosynthesis B2 protein n=1 Tax=Elongatibacter sediminis TaxID=3119006 RepID=UPI00339D9D23
MAVRWNTLRTLGWLDWLIFFQALWMLPWCALSLRYRSFQALYEQARSGMPTASPLTEDQQLALAHRVSEGVDRAAARGPYRANCLKRSLVLCRLLHKRGIPCEVKLGADLAASGFSAHAWVECSGTIIGTQEPGQRFKTLESRSRAGH